MYVPPEPKTGQQVLTWARKVTEYLKQISPRSSDNVKVSSTPGGTTLSKKQYIEDPYHFELIQDQTEPEKIAIRGGLVERVSGVKTNLEITAPGGPDEEFLAAGGSGIDDLAVSSNYITEGEEWVIFLGLYNTTWALEDPISGGAALYAGAIKGTIASPPADPTDPESDNALNWCRVLGRVWMENGLITFDPEWTGGNIKDFMLIPDGEGPHTSAVAQWVAGLDYADPATDVEQKGVLQDHQAHETIVDGDTVAQFNGDVVVPTFIYATAGETAKGYARVDANNSDLYGDEGASIERYTKSNSEVVLQVHKWYENGTVVQVADYTDFAGGADYDAGYTVLLRDNTDKEAKYASLYNFNAKTADEVLNVPPHALEDHDDYQSVSPNTKAAGRILVCDDGLTWDWQDPESSGLEDIFWPNTTIVDPSPYSYSLSGTLESTNATAASALGASVWTAGGIGAENGLYVEKGSASWAGYFEDGAGIEATLVDGTRAGLFVNGSVSGYAGGSTYAFESNGGGFNASGGDVYYYGGTAGATVTNWTGGGLVTGASVQRYRVRVMDADTGLDRDIEVLGIAI